MILNTNGPLSLIQQHAVTDTNDVDIPIQILKIPI